MRANLTSKRPCRIVAGDVRRIPQSGPAVSYLIGCVSCGKPTMINVGPFASPPDSQKMDEDALTLAAPAQCVRCGTWVTLTAGILTVRES